MKKTSKVKIIQPENEEIPTEVIAAQIKEISDGIRQMRNGRLNDKAIIYLIQKSSGQTYGAVKAVLDGMQNLEREFLK